MDHRGMEEIIAAILGFLWECLGEVLLQLAVEFVAELLVRALGSVFGDFTSRHDRKIHPLGHFFLYALLGGALGVVSQGIFPDHFIHKASNRWLNLIITPLIAGGCMAWLGCWHDKHGRRVVGLDRFFNGWGFALAFALVRYFWCR
jgi:hypothetical protein